MIFGSRSAAKSKTPVKAGTPAYRETAFTAFKAPSGAQPLKLKSKEYFTLVQALEEIYLQLKFEDFQAFPMDAIREAHDNLKSLLQYTSDPPRCPQHKQILNLYCETDKNLVCVACVYHGTMEHKSHKVRSVQSVEKVLDMERIRYEEKSKALVDELERLRDEIGSMQKEIQDHYQMVSKFTSDIIDQTIENLRQMKSEIQKGLSVSYRRTNTILARYSSSLDTVCTSLQSNLKKSLELVPLSKYVLLRELCKDSGIINDLVKKFNENRILMENWRKAHKDFVKLNLAKRADAKKDIFVITEF